MKKIVLILLMAVFILVGCNNSESSKVEDESTQEISKEDTKETNGHIDVVRKMLSEDASKLEIDTYVFAHINEMNENDIDEIAYSLIERITDNYYENIKVLINYQTQDELKRRYNEETKTFDLNNLDKEMSFINKAIEYGTVLNNTGKYVIFDINSNSFDAYEEYLSLTMKMYIHTTLNSNVFYGDEKGILSGYNNWASSARQIENILLLNNSELIDESKLMSTMHLINVNLAKYIPNSIQDLDMQYESQTRLNEEIIELYETILSDYDDICGLEDTITYIRTLKENDYVLNDDCYEYLTNVQSEEASFIKKYEKDIFENKKNINFESIEFIDLNQFDTLALGSMNVEKSGFEVVSTCGEMIKNFESIERMDELYRENKEGLSSREIGLMAHNIFGFAIQKCALHNETISAEDIQNDLLKLFDENKLNYLKASNGATVNLLNQIDQDYCKLVKENSRVYCRLEVEKFDHYLNDVDKHGKDVLMLDYDYYNYFYSNRENGTFSEECEIIYNNMSKIEDVLMKYGLEEYYVDYFTWLQFVYTREAIYEVPSTYGEYSYYLSGKGTFPEEMKKTYLLTTEKYKTYVFPVYIAHYYYMLIDNNDEHNEDSLSYLEGIEGFDLLDIVNEGYLEMLAEQLDN